MDLKDEAKLIAHGRFFRNPPESAEHIWHDLFAPDAKGEEGKYRGQLTLEEVQDIMTWTPPHGRSSKP